jgi:transposase
MILRMLHNPIYAGAYAYGRSEERMALVDGQVRRRHKTRFRRAQWKVCIQDHHPGYITWEEFMKNEEKLRENCTHADGPQPRGAVREGPALLQGLVLCGRCGSRMNVQYSKQARGQYLCRSSSRPSSESPVCWAVMAAAIDEAVASLFLEAVQLPEIELGLAITRETERQAAEIDAQWKLRLDRARYEASLAERRYKAVDPDNRVIARTLEREWEEKARDVESIEREHAEVKRRAKLELTCADRDRILALSRDLRRVWSAKTTTYADRKNLLRMLVREVALAPVDSPRRRTLVRVQWRTGAVNEFEVGQDPRERLATSEDAVTLISELCTEGWRDSEIAAELNRRGLMTGGARIWGPNSVRWVRFRHGLARREAPRRKPDPTQGADPRDGLYTSRMLAARFGVGETTVLRWVSRGLLRPEAGGGKGYSFRFRLDQKTEAVLQEAARKAREPNAGLHTSGMIAARFGVNEATVHRWVEKGLLRAASGGGKGHPFRFRLDADTEAALTAAAKKAHGPRRF